MSAAIACGWQRINILKKWLLLHEITNNFAQNHFSVFTFCIVQIGSVFKVRTIVTKASKAISRKCNNVKGIHARFVASSIRKTLKMPIDIWTYLWILGCVTVAVLMVSLSWFLSNDFLVHIAIPCKIESFTTCSTNTMIEDFSPVFLRSNN